MAFTAVVGKELMGMSYEEEGEEGKTILSTYSHTSNDTIGTDSTDEVEEKNAVASLRSSRPAMGDMGDDSEYEKPVGGNTYETRESKEYGSNNGSAFTDDQPEEAPKRRFRDSLNALEIEEAKATGRAQLGLAFEMLTMMKKRALKADPEAYQSLIDACGRVGDTKRASDLLARMHEDGIVADGTVYACLVAAFSADNAWRNGTKDEDLPGM